MPTTEKNRKYLNQCSGFVVCVLSSTLPLDSLYRDAVLISLQCSTSASVGRIFPLTLNLLRHIQISPKSIISNLTTAKGERPKKIAQTHQDHIQVGPDSQISSEVFLFSFRKLEKEKRRFCIYFFLNWGVYLSNKVLNRTALCCIKLFDCLQLKIVRRRFIKLTNWM